MTQFIDNLRSVQVEIAKLILTEPTLCQSHRKYLERYVTDESMQEYYDFNSEVADTNCTLYVRFDHSFTQRVTQPETGDVFCPVNTKVSINWPCHGSTEPRLANQRLSFYGNIVQLATRIQECCQAVDVWTCIQTKVEKDAEEKERAAAAEVELLRRIVADNNASMRVGSLRNMPEYTKIRIPLGHHTVPIDKKVYEVHHYDNGKIILERII